MSFLNTSTTVHTTTLLPAHISRDTVLAFLHNPDKMIPMNPLVNSHIQLPESSSTAFFKSVPAAYQPLSNTSELPSVYKVTESTAGASEEADKSWRGGWASRFIPDSLTYETSLEPRADGMLSLTHAPMGVNSVTIWQVREDSSGQLAIEKEGKVESNRMLMGFIRTTLQESHDNLARDFVAALEKEVGNGDEIGGTTYNEASDPKVEVLVH